MNINKYIVFVAFITLFSGSAHGQFSPKEQHQIDSLGAIIDDGGSHDTAMASAYMGLSELLYVAYPDTDMYLCTNAKRICEVALATHPPPLIERSLLFSLAGALNNIGYILEFQGQLVKGLEYYHRGLKIREELGEKYGIAESLNNIAGIHKDQGNIEASLEYLYQSLKVIEKIGDKIWIANSLNNLGFIHVDQGNVEEGLSYYYKSLRIREEVGEKKGIAESLNNIGSIYKGQKDIQKALEFYQRSLKIREEIGYERGVAISLLDIGDIYDIQGDLLKSLEFYQRSLKINEGLGDKKGISLCLNRIGDIYLIQENLSDALNSGTRGLMIGRELGNPLLIKMNANLLSVVAKRQGDFKEALKMYELYIQMRDSLKNEATQKATIRQQTKYEFEKAQLIREQDELEKVRIETEITERRDNLQYSVILIALLVLFGGVLALGFINVSERMAEGIIFFSSRRLFEFLLVLADPYIDKWSGGAPGIKLLFNAGIAALIFPMHSLFETKLKKRLAKREQEA